VNLSHFEIFLMVARLKSISKAAKLLFMTQPAISNHIHRMENYYGTKLFNRFSHGVTLTAAGEVVFEYGQKIVALQEAMERAIDSTLHLEDQKLVVGASSNVGNYALPCSICAFKEKYPEVNIRLEIANSAGIIQQVLDRKVDLGVVAGLVENKELKSATVFSDSLVLITPPTEKWAGKDSITLDELKNEPLLIREEGSGIRDIWKKTVADNGSLWSDFKVVMEMGSIDAIKSAVESGLGVSVVSRLSAEKEIRRGVLQAVTIEGISTAFSFHVIYRVENDQPSLATRFIRFLGSPEERSFC